MSKTATRNGRATRLPAAPRHERIIVCRMLWGEVDKVRSLVRIDDLSDHALRVIYAACLVIDNRGRRVSSDAALDELNRTGKAAELGNNPALFLADLIDADPTGADLDDAVEVVQNAALARRQLSLLREFEGRLVDPIEPAADTLALLQQRLAEIAAGPRRAIDTTWKYAPVAFGDFMAADYRREWLVKGVLVRGQPAMIAGPQKGMKTSIIADLAVSLASATPFLGRFPVPRPLRVEFLSGESGESTLQDTFRQIATARGIADPSGLAINVHTTLPRLGSPSDLDALRRGLAESRPDFVSIDPAYLCLLAGGSGEVNEGSVLQIGPTLARVNEVCAEVGATLGLAHHAVKRIPTGQPLELTDMAFAGFGEFARQWILVNREEKYQQDGHHRLIVSVGGSAKHSGLYAVHIDEGTIDEDFRGSKWEVAVQGWTESRIDEQAGRRIEKENTTRRKMAEEWAKVFNAIDSRTAAGDEAATQTDIRTHAAWSSATAKKYLRELIELGEIEEVEFTKSTGNKTVVDVTGYRRCSR